MCGRNVFVLVGLACLTACDATRPAGGPDGGPDGGPLCIIKNRFQHSVNRQLDLLFVVDNSPGMAGMQAKLARDLPLFVDALAQGPRGLSFLDLHLAFVTTSMGAGAFLDVPGCEAGGPGDGGGRFVHPSACGALEHDQSFIVADRGLTNFTGEMRDLFACMSNVGTDGCMFSQPLAALRRALEKAADPRDPDNGGFLRPNAYLIVVVVTNQDDCSVPPESRLFDPAQMSSSDPLGALGPYRCAEFGHTCGGQQPPHELSAGVDTLSLSECVASPGGGRLTPVAEFLDAFKALRPDRYSAVVSMIVAPREPYAVTAAAAGATQPVLAPSCRGKAGETGMPAPRLYDWANGVEWGGSILPICEDSFLDATIPIVESVIRTDEGVRCIQGTPVSRSDGTPDCDVFIRTVITETGDVVDRPLGYCDAHHANYPCWTLVPGGLQCSGNNNLRVCDDPTCALWSPWTRDREDVLISCAIEPPCGGDR